MPIWDYEPRHQIPRNALTKIKLEPTCYSYTVVERLPELELMFIVIYICCVKNVHASEYGYTPSSQPQGDKHWNLYRWSNKGVMQFRLFSIFFVVVFDWAEIRWAEIRTNLRFGVSWDWELAEIGTELRLGLSWDWDWAEIGSELRLGVSWYWDWAEIGSELRLGLSWDWDGKN